jgi:TatD DNase family protein
MARSPRVRAWGEIGLDFNRMYSPRRDQEACLLRQLEISEAAGLPVIFHERDSHGRLLDILDTYFASGREGVVHCFSGSHEDLERYLAKGLHIGITGILTMAKRGADLRRLAVAIPEDRILVETDAPYLTPAPQKNRTRRNEPAFVRAVVLKLASIRGTDPEDLARTLWQNTCRLFRLPA